MAKKDAAAKQSEPEAGNESAALANTGEDLLAALPEDFDFEGDAGFGFDKRFQVPAIKFNEDRAPGELYNKTTEASAERMTVIFLYSQKYRDYSVSHDDGETYQRVCSSDDARSGLGMVESTGEERPCAKCPHAKWTTDERGKRIKPDCNEGYGVVGMDLESDSLFLMRFQVTSFQAFDKLRDKYHGPQKIGTKHVKRLPLWFRRYDVSLARVEGGKKRSYYVPVIEPSNPELIEPGRANNVFESAKLMEENFGQVMSFHREDDTSPADMLPPLEEDSSGDYAGQQGQGFE